MHNMPYAIIALLFLLPLLLFLKAGHAYSAFTFQKFVRALNWSALVYLVLCVAAAFVFAYLENTYHLDEKSDNIVDVAAEASLGFMMLSLAGVLPLLIVLNIIKWLLPKKKIQATTEE
jgi:hypothetical protein